VVRLHMLAMSHLSAANHRLLSHTAVVKYEDYARILQDEFGPHGYKCPSFVAPSAMLWLASWVDPQAAEILPEVGKRYNIEPKNARQVLDYSLNTDVKQVVTRMAHAAIANGFIPDRSKDKSLTQSYVRPELDLSMVPNAENTAKRLASCAAAGGD
jgi:hypothetical protein